MPNSVDSIANLPLSPVSPRREWPRYPTVPTKLRQASQVDAQPPLDEYFNSLFTALGPQHWWPGETQFEVIVGAILTQNTSWKNVELALANLRTAGVFTPTAVSKVHIRSLQSLIRPSGYFPPEGAGAEGICPIPANRVSRIVATNVRHAND